MYWVYRRIASAVEAVVKGVVETKNDALEIVSGGMTDVKKMAGDVSKTVQESVGPALSKASEELPGTIQKVSDAVGEAAGSAKSAVKPHLEWIMKQVEELRK